MNPDYDEGPGRGFLLGLGGVGLLVGVVLASLFIFRLQPAYVPPVSVHPGEIVMPAGVGSVQTLNFAPANITVVVGVNNTIIWVNDDTIVHTVATTSGQSGGQLFSSPVMHKGDKFTITLTIPGTYHYECTIHPTWMRGTITVKAGA